MPPNEDLLRAFADRELPDQQAWLVGELLLHCAGKLAQFSKRYFIHNASRHTFRAARHFLNMIR